MSTHSVWATKLDKLQNTLSDLFQVTQKKRHDVAISSTEFQRELYKQGINKSGAEHSSESLHFFEKISTQCDESRKQYSGTHSNGEKSVLPGQR